MGRKGQTDGDNLLTQTRLERLLELAHSNPEDPFAHYGPAMEWKRENRIAEAMGAFAKLLKDRPDYLPTYYQYASLLLQMGDDSDAESVLIQGIATAEQQGQQHTRDELSQLLEQLRSD